MSLPDDTAPVLYQCVSDRYDNWGRGLYKLEEFLSMCEECFGERPMLVGNADDGWNDDEGLVLERVDRISNYTRWDEDSEPSEPGWVVWTKIGWISPAPTFGVEGRTKDLDALTMRNMVHATWDWHGRPSQAPEGL